MADDQRRLSRGQQNLYFKMLRDVAESQFPNASWETHEALIALQHKFYKARHNEGKSTAKLSKSAFLAFYEAAQKDSIEMFDESGLDEDKKPFDHGGKTE